MYTLRESSNSLCLGKDWVFFPDSDSDSGYMEIISTNGNQKIDLFKLNYSDYYYLDQLVEENSNDVSEEATGETMEEITEENQTDSGNETSN